jgi:uncharacterized protein YecT (DUF1311 family)
MPKPEGCAIVAAAAFLVIWPVHGRTQANEQDLAQEAGNLLSPEYRACMFSDDSPLDASRYDCLDDEYRRLDALLTQEYRAALARQPNDSARRGLERSERQWWRTRFDECEDAVADLGGATAAVIREACAIDVLARRVVSLRRYQR